MLLQAEVKEGQMDGGGWGGGGSKSSIMDLSLKQDLKVGS